MYIGIDPGHGGRQPGAVNKALGLIEKDITLKISTKVAADLEKHDHRTILTRTYDTNVTLLKRCYIANRICVDIFLSIHCNSFKDPAANGIETWCYRKGFQGERLAKHVQSELINSTHLKDRGVQAGNLYVIRYTTMPAVLIELPFLSNPDEGSLYKVPDFLTICAAAITKGLLLYIETL
jgi:N-acetylmuramoyl-L-alanine amidase